MHVHFWLLETPFYELCRLFQGAFKYISVWKLQRHAIFRYNWTMSKILNHHMFSCPIFNSFNIKKKPFTSYPIYVSKFSWSQFWMWRSCLHAPLYVFFHISYYKERHIKIEQIIKKENQLIALPVYSGYFPLLPFRY